jgi:carotenoid cleavage dioxygenase-like enzyme
VIDHAPLLERAFELDVEERSYRIEKISGTVPDYVRGTYYVNGPSCFRKGEVAYRHWLDGDGMVCSLRFQKGGVVFTNRFVRSTKYTEEAAAGRALYRTFGTRFEGDRLHRGVGLESPVNVSVYPFAGTLLAFGEQGLPWELDPETLETRGLYTFGRKLNPISPFSAHPNFDPATGEMFNFGTSFSRAQPLVNLYRFSPDGGLVYRRRLPIDAPYSTHDFGLSRRYAVFYLSPHVLDMEALRRDGSTIMEALTWEPDRGSEILIASREDGAEAARVPIGSGYCLHLVNCHEENGCLNVDVVELEAPVYDQYDVPRLFPDVRRARPKRYVVDVEAGELAATTTLDYELMCDFPAVDPRLWERDYGDFWVLGISATEEPGRKFFDQVVRCDWRENAADVYQAPPRCYLGGEPVFLPDVGDERRGSVICQKFEAESGTSSFLVFDAFDVAGGPVATLELESAVPLLFHACYEPRTARRTC